MFLSNYDIKKSIINKEIDIIPSVEECNIESNGIRLHFGENILVPDDNQFVDLRLKNYIKYNSVSLSNDYVLKPRQFILASSKEKIMMSRKLIGFLEGRSTLARLGLSVHCTSGLIDNMFEEHRCIVFEIFNNGIFDIILYNCMPICTLLFSLLLNEVEGNASKQYSEQKTVLGPIL